MRNEEEEIEEDFVKKEEVKSQVEQKPVPKQIKEPEVEEEPTLKVTLERKEVFKILALIESSKEFEMARVLELETTLMKLYQPLYDWYMKVSR